MNKLKIYTIKEDYIHYLRKVDDNVLINKKERRPYVGIVYQINNYSYYIPLTSPKPKHAAMSNCEDFHKLNGGRYGAINFNKMIPVPDNVLIETDIHNTESQSYKGLLGRQYISIKSIQNTIFRKSEELYTIFFTDDSKLTPHSLKVKNRCCRFDLLEIACLTYLNEFSGFNNDESNLGNITRNIAVTINEESNIDST